MSIVCSHTYLWIQRQLGQEESQADRIEQQGQEGKQEEIISSMVSELNWGEEDKQPLDGQEEHKEGPDGQVVVAVQRKGWPTFAPPTFAPLWKTDICARNN